jgi:hypothetical protein
MCPSVQLQNAVRVGCSPRSKPQMPHIERARAWSAPGRSSSTTRRTSPGLTRHRPGARTSLAMVTTRDNAVVVVPLVRTAVARALPGDPAINQEPRQAPTQPGPPAVPATTRHATRLPSWATRLPGQRCATSRAPGASVKPCDDSPHPSADCSPLATCSPLPGCWSMGSSGLSDPGASGNGCGAVPGLSRSTLATLRLRPRNLASGARCLPS